MRSDVSSCVKVMVSAVTLMAFLFNIFAYDTAWGFNAPADRTQSAPIVKIFNPDTFILPPNLGIVKDSWVAPNPHTRKPANSQTIIHVQDAHCNYDSQHKIAEIVQYMNREYGIDTVNLEGGARDYDLSPLTNIKDGSVREGVADRLVKAGLVNGAEYFAVNYPGNISLWGMEDVDLYIGNLKAYRESLKNKVESDRLLAALSRALTALKIKVYSKALLELDSKYTQFKASNLSFKDYLAYLIKAAGDNGVKIAPFENIYKLSEALQMESGIDFKKANVERDQLIDKLQGILSRIELTELVEKTVLLKAEKLPQDEFYVYLLGKAEEVKIGLAGFKELEKYAAYIRAYSSVNKSRIIEEVDNLEAALKGILAKRDDERELIALSKNLAIMKNIFNISLTKDDYKYYKDNIVSFEVRNYTDFMGRQAPKYGLTFALDKEVDDLDRYREEMTRFYEYSLRRDEAFVKNIRLAYNEKLSAKRYPPNANRAAILITGGFHTENLAELFKKNGISYISILPNFKNCDGYESPYFKILSGEKNIRVEDALQPVPDKSLAIPDPFNPVITAAVSALDAGTAAQSAPASSPTPHSRGMREMGPSGPFEDSGGTGPVQSDAQRAMLPEMAMEYLREGGVEAEWFQNSQVLPEGEIDPFFRKIAEYLGGTAVFAGGSDITNLLLGVAKSHPLADTFEVNVLMAKAEPVKMLFFPQSGSIEFEGWRSRSKVTVGADEIVVNGESATDLRTMMRNTTKRKQGQDVHLVDGHPGITINVPLKHTAIVVVPRQGPGRIFFRTAEDRDNYQNKILTLPDPENCPLDGGGQEDRRYTLEYSAVLYARGFRSGWRFIEDGASLRVLRHFSQQLADDERAELVSSIVSLLKNDLESGYVSQTELNTVLEALSIKPKETGAVTLPGPPSGVHEMPDGVPFGNGDIVAGIAANAGQSAAAALPEPLGPKKGSLSDLVTSSSRLIPGMAKLPFPHFMIYFNPEFQALTSNMQAEEKYSVALAAFRFLNRNHPELSWHNIASAVRLIIDARGGISDREVFGPDTAVINICHSETRFDLAKMARLESESGAEKIIRDAFEQPGFIGRNQKYAALENIGSHDPKTPLTIFFNGHGGKNHLWLNHGSVGQEYSDEMGNPDAISYIELGNKLLKRGKDSLSNVTILISSCHSYDFSVNLLAYLARNGATNMPVVVSSSNFDSLSYQMYFIDSLLHAHHKGRSFSVGDVFTAETHARPIPQDFAVFIPEASLVNKYFGNLKSAVAEERRIVRGAIRVPGSVLELGTGSMRQERSSTLPPAVLEVGFEGRQGNVSTGDLDTLANPADAVIAAFKAGALNFGITEEVNKLVITSGVVTISGKEIRIVINNLQDGYATTSPDGTSVSVNLSKINSLLNPTTLTTAEKQAALERVLIHEIAEAYALQIGRNDADSHHAGMFAEAMHPAQSQAIRDALGPVLKARDHRQAAQLSDSREMEGVAGQSAAAVTALETTSTLAERAEPSSSKKLGIRAVPTRKDAVQVVKHAPAQAPAAVASAEYPTETLESAFTLLDAVRNGKDPRVFFIPVAGYDVNRASYEGEGTAIRRIFEKSGFTPKIVFYDGTKSGLENAYGRAKEILDADGAMGLVYTGDYSIAKGRGGVFESNGKIQCIREDVAPDFSDTFLHVALGLGVLDYVKYKNVNDRLVKLLSKLQFKDPIGTAVTDWFKDPAAFIMKLLSGERTLVMRIDIKTADDMRRMRKQVEEAA